jgi:hypothetical protein
MIRYMDDPPGGEYIPVVCAPLGRSMQLVLLGKVTGVLTHYIDGRSYPCTGAGFACEWCNVQRPRWKGYGPARNASRKKVVLEVTLGMRRAHPILTTEEVAGRWVEVIRKGPRRNSPALLSFLEHRAREAGGQSFDVRPVLWRMWDIPPPGEQ